MTDSIYADALERVERRLSRPRDLALHAILFSAVTTVATLSNLVTYAMIPDATYIGIYFWCMVLAAHGFIDYRRSGLSKNAREQAVQEELLRLAAEYDLSVEELVDLHARLAEDVAERATPLRATLATIVGYETLWGGWLMTGLLLATLNGYYMFQLNPFMVALQMAPFVGTTILGFVQLVTMFFGRRPASEDDELRNAYLRALYNTKLEKSKRQATQRLAIDDEGEIIIQEGKIGHRKLG
jgi:hypothetical protein